MHHQIAASLLVASAGLAAAAPAADINKKTFQLQQVPSGQTYLSGPLALNQAYSKYARIGANAPANVKAAAAAARQSGSVTAKPEQYDASYLCPVNVGGQTLNLDFDTGSSDLWVFSTETPAGESTGHAKYNPKTSGKILQGESWKIGYADGSGASGDVYADKVVVGPVTATSQAVEAATSVSQSFTQNEDTDGLLGLAFSSINTVEPQQQKTFFDTVKSTLAKPLFAVDLKKGAAGTYDFGYLDQSKYTGPITYVPVDNSQGFWGFTAGGSGAGKSVSGHIGDAIADTGTTLLLIPDEAVSGYYNQVDGAQFDDQQGGYVFDCNANLPDFSVEIGGKVFTIPGSYITFAPTEGSQCFGGIQSNQGVGQSIFGDIFLKSVYAIFDQTEGSPRLGFAEQS